MAVRIQVALSVGFFVLLTLVVDKSTACQTRQGCRINNGACLCGVGCEYRYTDQQECRKALRGRRSDICQRTPCLHEGSCIQSLSNDMGFKCRCEGTGFHGKRCEHACPKLNSALGRVENFPYECIVI